jgi:chromosome segregation ATPase
MVGHSARGDSAVPMRPGADIDAGGNSSENPVGALPENVCLSAPESVSAAPAEPLAVLESAQTALDELHDGQDEFEHFFGEVFDQLQSLSLELFARHKCLELTSQHEAEQETAEGDRRRQFDQLLEEVRQSRAQWQASHDEAHQAWAEWRAAQETAQQERAEVSQLHEELRGVWAELRGSHEEAQRQREELRGMYETAQAHLARLAGIAAELAEARSQSGGEGQPEAQRRFQQMWEDAQQQRIAWEQERIGMEAELEAVRARAADLSEALAEQKRQAAQQQAGLAGELGRMRSLLEALCGQMRGQSVAGEARPTPREAAAAGGDPVLESVLAQFEMLQQDVARRRPKAKHDRP